MAINRLLAGEQLFGDLLAGQAFGDQLDDLQLAGRDRVLGCRFVAAGSFELVTDERPHRRGVEERLAAHRRSAGLDQVAVGDPLDALAPDAARPSASCPTASLMDAVGLMSNYDTAHLVVTEGERMSRSSWNFATAVRV
jgi:hypothetical protein